PPKSGAKRAGAEPPRLTTVRTKEAPKPPPKVVTEPVAVVGLAAHFGPWADLRAFQERVLGGDDTPPARKRNGWGLAAEPCPPGYYIEELHFPTDRFRIPPKELEETLPQQLLVLKVAAAALDDAANGRHVPADGDDPTTGAFIGLGLDPNTTNFHLRWSVLAGDRPDAADLASPPLTANRTMGALGSIAASRIARAFHFGGPSHTVCSEEASTARAVELAVRALRANEIDRALVGGVDLAGDPRCVLPGGITLPGEGAAALVLKRLADAERDGDRVYAVVRGVGVAGGEADGIERAAAAACGEADVPFDSVGYLDGPGSPGVAANRPAPLAVGWADQDVGHAGAASAAAGMVKTCLALYQEIIPPARTDAPPSPGVIAPKSPRYWLHDTASGPRRAAVTAAGTDGSCFAVLLEESAKAAADPSPALLQPLGARAEGLFVVDGGSPAELVGELGRLRQFVEAHPDRQVEALARGWFREALPKAGRVLAVALVARSADELLEQVAFAADSIRTDPARPLPGGPGAGPRPAVRDRVFYTLKPLGPKAKVALVFPGSGNQFDGMGRDLGAHWPEVLRRQQAESTLLRSQFAPDFFWDDRTAGATARDLMFGQVTVGSLVSDVVASLGVKVEAMVGISLGESAGLFGVRAWRARDEMYRRMKASTLFNSDLAPPYDAARKHWGVPAGRPVEWVSGVIAASPDDVVAALRPGLKAYLLIVNTPTECVIGGRAKDVEMLASAVGKPLLPLAGVTLAHCDAGSPVEVPYRELHTLPVTPPRGLTVYSGARGRGYALTSEAAADSITAGLLHPIDVPAVVTAAYRDGVRAFVEVGPGGSCTRMIDAVLGDKPHLARAAHVARQDAVSQVLRLAANLIAERVPVDLTDL
ncbi:MAG: hypothetical protein K2P78_01575, partial [Gemmataceae bacterium]|nr:hypothetical protein [Gemmataceae bacterium]